MPGDDREHGEHDESDPEEFDNLADAVAHWQARPRDVVPPKPPTLALRAELHKLYHSAQTFTVTNKTLRDDAQIDVETIENVKVTRPMLGEISEEIDDG